MKWFKHDTDARNDLKIKLLKKEFGAEGYGVYFQLIEVIGEYIERDNLDEWGFVEPIHTIETLADESGVTPDKLRAILIFCNKIGLLEKRDGRLYCKKVEKRLDEYMQKLISKKADKPKNKRVPTKSRQTPVIDEIRRDEIRRDAVAQNVSQKFENAPSLGKRYREVLKGKSL